MRPLLAILVCSCILASCRDATTTITQPDAELLQGTWVRVPLQGEPPGSGFSVVLSLTGSTITGAGNWHGEGGPSGSVAVTGNVTGEQITLELTFVQLLNGVEQGRSTEAFSGHLTSRSDLEGTTTANGLTGTLHLRKSPAS